MQEEYYADMPDAGYTQPPAPNPYYTPENTIDNIVAQIDPANIIDNLDHSLRGEVYSKEKGIWEMNPSGKPLVNDACRGAIMSYMSGILTNNTTMGIVDATQLSNIMESVIETINKKFAVNLEEFGFVPPGPGYKEGRYENKGTPDTARMTLVSNMIYIITFITLTRALNGMESKKIFSSLKMNDTMGYQQPQQNQGFISRIFGR